MGNQQSFNLQNHSPQLAPNLDQSSMTYLYHVENANLVKYHLPNQYISTKDHPKTHKNPSPIFFLEKIFVSDSEQEYKLLSKYLQKQSLFSIQPQSSEIIKILKIYQESQKGLCSNRYFIKALFEYSDITLRQEIRTRASNRLNKKNSTVIQKNHFRYDDLCSIMFACISAFFTVQKMRRNFISFVEKNLVSQEQYFRHLEEFINQFRYNIPLNLDRLIIMQDGTIKVIHPLLIDHDNRIHHSSKFFYSPQKMKDFVLEDGIKGRIFETALVILQCALLESTEQMSKIYNGYCINQNLLRQKIETAEKLYRNLEKMKDSEMKLFEMLTKMLEINPEKRAGLDECIVEAQSLFQVNKKLKESADCQVFKQIISADPYQRMRVQELELPSHQISIKDSPIKNSIKQSTNIKFRDEEKTTARMKSYQQTEMKKFNQNPEIEISHFDVNAKRKSQQKPDESMTRYPFESLMIENHNQDTSVSNINEKYLESLIGKGSDLYNTQKYNFLESKFQYQKLCFNPLKNSQIDEGYESNNSSCKKYPNSQENKGFKYKKLLEQSARNSEDKKTHNNTTKFQRQKLLREGPRVKYEKSLITTSKFMDIEQIYDKYDFITKSNDRKGSAIKNECTSNSFVSIKNEQSCRKRMKNEQDSMKDGPFTFSLQNSIKGSSKGSQREKFNETNKSQVLQKITPEHIYEKLKKNKMLR